METSGILEAVASSAKTEEQQKTVFSVGRFLQQRNVVWKITSPYLIGWTLAALALAFFLNRTFGGFMLVLMCFVGILGYAGVFVLGARVWRSKISALMDFPSLLAEREYAQIGETFTVRYSHHYKQATTIEELKIQFVLREWVRYTQGTSTYTDTRDIVIGEDWWDMVDVRAGETIEREMQFAIPHHGMHTWTTPNNNRISYMFKLNIDLPGWLDYQDVFSFVVTPEVSDVQR